jgi:hypothetical protein
MMLSFCIRMHQMRIKVVFYEEVLCATRKCTGRIPKLLHMFFVRRCQHQIREAWYIQTKYPKKDLV